MITAVVPIRTKGVAIPASIDVLLQRNAPAVQQAAELTKTSSATGSEEILSLPGDYFTVQLMAMKNEQKVLEYASDNGIEDPLYVNILSQDVNWYVLLLGAYPDQSTADNARVAWEESRDLEVEPWTRRLSTLQDAIRQALDQ
jgi:septal ring-binding cell division protein DamX